jgi:hypothetical protein
MFKAGVWIKKIDESMLKNQQSIQLTDSIEPGQVLSELIFVQIKNESIKNFSILAKVTLKI